MKWLPPNPLPPKPTMQLVSAKGRILLPGLSLLYPLAPLEMKENHHHKSSALFSSQAQHIPTTGASGPSLPSSQQEDQPALRQKRASQRSEEGPTRAQTLPPPRQQGSSVIPQLQCDERPQSCWGESSSPSICAHSGQQAVPSRPRPNSQHKPWRQQGRRQSRDPASRDEELSCARSLNRSYDSSKWGQCPAYTWTKEGKEHPQTAGPWLGILPSL